MWWYLMICDDIILLFEVDEHMDSNTSRLGWNNFIHHIAYLT